MRLSADQVREALLHPDEGVRRLALEYFAGALTTDPTVTATALEGIARFGPDDYFSPYYNFAHLPQTAESVRWAVDRFPVQPPTSAGIDRSNATRRGLIQTFLECPFALFAPHEATVLALPLSDHERTDLSLRRPAEGLADDALWDRLLALANIVDADEDPWDMDEYREAERLVLSAAHRPALAGRVLERVNVIGPPEFKFLDQFAVRVAGGLRLADAAAPLVRCLTWAEEVWHEDISPALCRIGSNECVPLVRDLWAGGSSDFRFSAVCLLGAIHTDASAAACLELAAAERKPYSDGALTHRLLESAVKMFDTAAVEPARQFLLKLPAGWNRRTMYERDLRGSLVDACLLTGERFPEYDKWRRDEIEATAKARRRMAGLESLLPLDHFDDGYEPHPGSPQSSSVFDRSAPPSPPPAIVGKAAAGRNDPCPCGSGKKFKKCCGK